MVNTATVVGLLSGCPKDEGPKDEEEEEDASLSIRSGHVSGVCPLVAQNSHHRDLRRGHDGGSWCSTDDPSTDAQMLHIV